MCLVRGLSGRCAESPPLLHNNERLNNQRRNQRRRRIRDQTRQQAFIRRREASQFMELVDAAGNCTFAEGDGRLHNVRHEAVQSALSERANRFNDSTVINREHQQQPHRNRGIDDTGTIGPTLNQIGYSPHLATQVSEEMEVRVTSNEILEAHGTNPGPKQVGVFRLLYENANGIDCRHMDGYKVRKARSIHDKLEADIVAYNEHRINYQHKSNEFSFGRLFRGGETEMRSVVAYNVHENVRRVQEGGTAMMLFGPLVQQYNSSESIKDETGLGRWVVITLTGAEGFTTRIVCGYNPCGNSRLDTGTVYAQHRRFWLNRGCNVCPRVKFRQDLQALLSTWRENGDRLVVCLDANEDIYRKSIGKMLTDKDGLAMKETVGEFTGSPIGATYFRGSKPIDGVWTTSDINITSACVMPVGYGIGDHRMFVIDMLSSSLVGQNPVRVLRPCARRLTTKLPGVIDAYNESLEDLVLRHRIIERMGQAHEESGSNLEATERMNVIDTELKQYMLHSERKCRKIKSGVIPFSPESEIWIRRRQTYYNLLRRSLGNRCNTGNLLRAARRCGIQEPLNLSGEEIRQRIAVCDEQCTFFKDHGGLYRKRHLQQRAEAATAEGNDDVAKHILNMITRERQRDMWRRLKHSMAHQSGRSVGLVQVEQDTGNVVEYSTQEGIEHAIWSNIHQRRFFLAEEAPICQGQLRQDFGYLANTLAGQAVMDGEFTPMYKIDPATEELFSAIAFIRSIIPKDHISDIITAGDWGRHWKRGVREETSSSESGLHFGHQIASAHSPLLSHTHALQCSISLRRGMHLDRWSRGLSVMLEKVHGCALVSKLRSILLMEADANAVNKMMFGIRMLQTVRDFDLIPDEIFSERNRTADDGTLSKVLFYDLVRQSRRPAGVSSVDADNCFDRIAHAMASLIFQACGVTANSATTMLSMIQEMQFFLRTAFGDSTTAAGSTFEIKTQGLCQGSGAAPAGWMVISITILQAHKANGHGATFLCPISGESFNLAAILFVDDTDVIHFRMHANESTMEAHQRLQESVLSWGNLLIATGGSLKPVKCFYHLISFTWNRHGQWSYSDNHTEECLQIFIPQPNDTLVPITHLGVNDASKTLGSMTCPSGKAEAAIDRIQEKAQTWIDDAKNAKLSRRDIWFLVDRQFWPKVGFGCSTIVANFDTLTRALHRQYYQLLPLGGIRRSVCKEVRYLGKWFFGCGCPHFGVECFAGQMEKLLTHYGSKTAVGKLLQSSMEMLVIELGLSSQPLLEKYAVGSNWTTHSWIRSLWEKIDLFNIQVTIGNIDISPPRVGDEWLMRRFMKMGCSVKELTRLNRVRLAQQCIFVSDVLDAGGRALDRKYLNCRPHTSTWSQLTFPREVPSSKDFRLWRRTLLQLRAGGRHSETRVREFIKPGHKVWNWRFDESGEKLLHFTHDGKMDIYRPSQASGFARRPNCWTRTSPRDVAREDNGVICSVKLVSPGVLAVCSWSQLAPPQPNPTSFWDVLVSWGCTWMWDQVKLIGDINWIAGAIDSQECIAVTDGSFMRELTSEVCSTAFFFENSDRSCKLVGAFPERSETANAYRGELLGIMAIHLILLAVNKVAPNLAGSITIYSDCERALGSVDNLPKLKIPPKYKHSDILKNIMINCSQLSFNIHYKHISAHQDDRMDFSQLSRPAQLNCAVDMGAKRQLLELDPLVDMKQHNFPLEPVVCFAGTVKLTASMSWFMRFYAHKQLARDMLSDMNVLSTKQFNEISWQHVAYALDDVPRMFQLWACKQVLGIASTNGTVCRWDTTIDSKCPSCNQCVETTDHVLQCDEVGRVDTLLKTIDYIETWLLSMGTDPVLAKCLIQYARGRGSLTMESLCAGLDTRFQGMARSQDLIGWRRFMEGMLSRGVVAIQKDYWMSLGSVWKLKRWSTGLIIKLLEATHGQWLYRNVVVHDKVAGTLATTRKETLLEEIDAQIARGEDGLLEEHRYLLEINLDSMSESDGETQEYWLLAIMAARVACASRTDESVSDLITDSRLRPRRQRGSGV